MLRLSRERTCRCHVSEQSEKRFRGSCDRCEEGTGHSRDMLQVRSCSCAQEFSRVLRRYFVQLDVDPRSIRSHDVEKQKIQRNLCPSLPALYAQEKATSHPHAPKTRSRASTQTAVAASFVVKQTILRRTVGSGNLVRYYSPV